MDVSPLLADLLVGRTPAWPGGLYAAPPSEEAWSEIAARARKERVAPLLACMLAERSDLDVPAPVRASLDASYRAAVYASLLHQTLRSRLCRSFGEASIPLLLLKGAALAFTVYDDPATRPMVDLDLLVPRQGLEAAARYMEADGFHLLSGGSFPEELRSPRGHLVYIHGTMGGAVELHWELRVLGRAGTRALPRIWGEALAPPGIPHARVMRPGHLVPMLCAHMVLQHQGARLLWLHDLHRVLGTLDEAEATVLRQTASAWRLVPCTARSLLRTRELFGTALPEDLSRWAEAAAARDGLQARMTELSLFPGAREKPSAGLADLMMNRDWSLLRSMFPRPADMRSSPALEPGTNLLAAYAVLMGRRLRRGPAYLAQLWRCWRAVGNDKVTR